MSTGTLHFARYSRFSCPIKIVLQTSNDRPIGERIHIRHDPIERIEHSSAATTLIDLNLSSSEVAEPDRDKAVAVLIQDASAQKGEIEEQSR